MKKIAFCFVTRNEILPEKFWIDFFDGVDTNKYNIYIHCDVDYSLQSEFFKKYEIKNKVLKFGNNTVDARLKLMENYVQDVDNYKAIFLSEDMIPIFDFNTIYEYCIKDDKSSFAFFNNPNLNRGINFTHKNSDWHILNTTHINIFLQYNNMKRFADGQIGSEHFPSTILFEHNELSNINYAVLLHEDWNNFNKFNNGLPIYTLNISSVFINKIKNLRHGFNLFNEGYTIDLNNTVNGSINENNKTINEFCGALFLRKIINNDLFDTYKNID